MPPHKPSDYAVARKNRKLMDAAFAKGQWFTVGYYAVKLDPKTSCPYSEPAKREQWELGARNARAEVNRQ